MLLNVLYLLWTFLVPIECGPTEYQVFIDADRDENTGYVGGYEFVVRGVLGEPALDLRDWAEVQNMFGRTLNLDGLKSGVVVRHTLLGRDNLTPVPRAGWGRFAGFALEDQSQEGWLRLRVPQALSGRTLIEFYQDGRLCPSVKPCFNCPKNRRGQVLKSGWEKGKNLTDELLRRSK